MKKLFFTTAILLLVSTPFGSSAADIAVTVEWTIPTSAVSGIQNYILNYSPNNNMSDAATQTCEPWQPTDTLVDQTSLSMTCNAVPVLPDQIAYFTLEAIDAEGTSLFSDVFSRSANLSTPLNFQLLTDAYNTEPIYAINFQPTDAPVPDGFLPAYREDFDSAKGYGWTISNLTSERDRDNPLSPDQAYDTNIGVYPNSVFELVVPNGTYEITVCIGDASYPNSTNSIKIEGATVFESQELNSATRWKDDTISVPIVDNKLTISFAGSTPYSQLCWLKIYSQTAQ